MQAALALVGTPYVYQAAHPDKGFDCVSCVRYLGDVLGIRFPLVEMPEYKEIDRLQLGDMLNFFSKIGFRQVEAWGPLDIVLLIGPRYHVGLMLNNEGEFFHCTEEDGTAVDSIRRTPWKKNLKFFFKLR